MLFAKDLRVLLIDESTENFSPFESTNNNPMSAVVVEYGHRTADGLSFCAVCFHYPANLRQPLVFVKGKDLPFFIFFFCPLTP